LKLSCIEGEDEYVKEKNEERAVRDGEVSTL
jgi:hypothetical protein